MGDEERKRECEREAQRGKHRKSQHKMHQMAENMLSVSVTWIDRSPESGRNHINPNEQFWKQNELGGTGSTTCHLRRMEKREFCITSRLVGIELQNVWPVPVE